MKKNKLLSMMIAVIMFVTILFSYEYIAQNAHHNCSGEECPVCMELAMAAQTISRLSVIPVLLFSMAVLWVYTLVHKGTIKRICVPKTLITLKVELLS